MGEGDGQMKYNKNQKTLTEEKELKDYVINNYFHMNIKKLKEGCNQDADRKLFEF